MSGLSRHGLLPLHHLKHHSLVKAVSSSSSTLALHTSSSCRHLHTKRGGQSLSERYTHLARRPAVANAFGTGPTSDLSAPGLAHEGSQQAASRLAREGDEYTLLGHVRVPKKPQPPGEEECCMSGCAVCVYDLYIEAKAAYSTALSNALTELREQDVPREDWPAEVIALDAKLNSSGSKSGAAVDSSAVFEDEGPLDATLRAFMELEKKLKSTG